MQIPRHIKAFRDALLAVKPAPIPIPDTAPPIVGLPGIRESTRIQYNKHDFEELTRVHEYSFALRDGRLLELSVQLYMNNRDHWRLFAYSVVDGNKAHGMLFSINLTVGQDDSDTLALKQTLMLAARDATKQERSQDVEALVMRLRSCGFKVQEDRKVDLGGFNTARKAFTGTTAAAFMRDFVVTAVLKGPYMGNKGYDLAALGLVAQSARSPRRTEPTLDAAEAAADDDGAFDPQDGEDAREKTLAAITRRQGQPDFRKALLKAYEGRCAVTGCDFEGALEAAHITPYVGIHTNHITNGLLLRADIHTLFDLRHIAVDSKTMKIRIARALRGTVYETLEGKVLTRPRVEKWHPSPLALDDHKRKAGL